METRADYAEPIDLFLARDAAGVIGQLAQQSTFALETTPLDAWSHQVTLLHGALGPYAGRGKVYFEYAVPRLGKRIDVVAVIDHVLFVLEFKVGEEQYTAAALDQVLDYALDLKNFHESSHGVLVAPVLVATRAPGVPVETQQTVHRDGLLRPIRCSAGGLSAMFSHVLAANAGERIDAVAWERGRYCPTPTIVEAAMALYGGHDVAEISRSDAGATNLTRTSAAVANIIRESRDLGRKSIVFVTGVPGAGKTLVGLDVATKHIDKASDLYSVFLSGNGPLVSVMQAALARDKVRREKLAGRKFRVKEATSEVKMFVQNVHHFRDECLVSPTDPPLEHVALFDEAQRAWNLQQTASFMLRKKKRPDFNQSEPEFLISCLNRHRDWATVVCLVGGGQEINTGEAGIGEWGEAILRSFSDWHVHISPRLHDAEYGAGEILQRLAAHAHVHPNDDLHLAVSMRSFRAEDVSSLVKHLLDLNEPAARDALDRVKLRYPIVLTRDLRTAKAWVREMARGTERYGLVVSSGAQRLRPHAIDVRYTVDPEQWFLYGKDDVRSSYYLEDAATEFQVQGLELHWTCVVWDGDGLGAGALREYDAFYQCCRMAKAAGITVLALAHVNKANQIAGPKGLEHFVDCVLRLERAGAGRLLSAPKNRFYREQQIGLALDTDETTAALSPSPHCEPMTGVARTFVGGELGEAEVQVRLSLPLPGEKPKIHAPNLPTRRIEQLVRSISAARGIDLADLNLNISSLLQGDAGFRSWVGLPLAISLASSLLRRRVPPPNVYLGEIDLNRSIRPLSRGLIEVLTSLADSEPFPPSTRVFLPAQSAVQLDGFPSELVPCATFDQALALTWPDIT